MQKIKLLSRKRSVENKPVIQTELTSFQNLFFDEEILKEHIENKEEHLYHNIFDFLNEETIEYDFKTKIIGIDPICIDTFTNELSIKLVALLQSYGIEELIFLSHLKFNVFGWREKGSSPLEKAHQHLEKIVGSSFYDEALLIPIAQLHKIVNIAFWLTRCDPSIPEYLLFFDTNEHLHFFICKYGNVHFTELSEKHLDEEEFCELGFSLITGQEWDYFSENGNIQGRKIEV